MDRCILHSDLNSFYASVEMMLDPNLQGKAVAVCGSTEERHGIVLAKSELAKKAGVKTGMVNWEAKQRCPNLILVKPQYGQYLKYGKLAREIYGRYTDQIEPFGMDECWLDVTGSCHLFGDGKEIADRIRKEMEEELGLTVSVGVSYNKVFAKLGSDMQKPNATTVITKESMEKDVWSLPASDLLYCGRATTKKLGQYAIRTIGDIAKASPDFLKRRLGVNGIMLWNFANGRDQSVVKKEGTVAPIMSIGHGITCTSDLISEEEVWKVMLELTQDIAHKLRLHGLEAQGVQITVRDASLFIKQYQGKLELPTQSAVEIATKARALFHKQYAWNGSVRSVTVRAIGLVAKGEPEQMSLYIDHKRRDRRMKVEDTVEEIRNRFGKHAIYAATLLGDIKMPKHSSHELVMPGGRR